MKLRVSISSFFAVLFCLGAAAQDARFKPASIGVTLDNPSYLVDFNSASGTARWVHYELLGGETSGGASRTDDFRADRRVVRNSPSASSYRGSNTTAVI